MQHGLHLAHLVDHGDLRQRARLGGLEFFLGPLQNLDLVLGVGEVLIRFRGRVQAGDERLQALAEGWQVGQHRQGALDLHRNGRKVHDRRGDRDRRRLLGDVGGNVLRKLLPAGNDLVAQFRLRFVPGMEGRLLGPVRCHEQHAAGA